MKSTPEQRDHSPDKGAEAQDKVSAKIAEVRSSLRASAGKTLKGKARERIDSLMERTAWTVKVAACEIPEDFLALFALHKIPEETWRKTGKLMDAGLDALYVAIREYFRGRGGWKGFLDFMPEQKKQSMTAALLYLPSTQQVAACDTPEDFLALFALHKIPEETWRSTGKFIKAGYKGLYKAIQERFRHQGGWPGFLIFLNPPEKREIDEEILKLRFTDQIAACGSPEDFLALFALHKIPEETWRSSYKLRKAGYSGLSSAITDRFDKHGGWKSFLDFMPPPKQRAISINQELLKLPFIDQVAACDTPEDFLALFALHKIPEETWRSTHKLRMAGWQSLYAPILDRFRERGGWKSFLDFMPPPKQRAISINQELLKLPFIDQVAACDTPEDFLALFALHKIPEETWRSSYKLYNGGHGGLYHAINKRFRTQGSWEGFLAFMDGKDDETLDAKLLSLNLEDAVAVLAHQPSKLKAYLSISHPELLPDEIDTLVSHSFKRLHARRTYDYSDFTEALDPVALARTPKHTAEAAIPLEGVAEGADAVLVQGNSSTRRITVAEDGSFSARISLAVGARNVLRVTPLHHGKKQIGPETEIVIHQTGEPDDIEALVALLEEMGAEAIENIKSDPGRHEYVVRQAEQVFIRKFSGSFAKGKAYMEKLIANAKTPAIRTVLKAVLKRFTAINETEHPNVKKGAPLYFFQKYCVAEIQRAIKEGKNGIVLANDPGLGKTRTALVAVNGDPATIVTPNSVVTSWAEEAQKALIDADILVLQDMHSKERKDQLRETDARHCVTNVEFLRATEGDERYGLLSNEDTIVIQDEAHGLLNLGSEQSKGSRRLPRKFLLLLSATPAKDPKTLRRLLHLLEPDDPRFSSDPAFVEAFPANDADALKTLSVIKQQFMLRFTKEDVLETMDPSKPIAQQKHRLPRKEHIPEEQMGSYELTDDQCEAMYELFMNFPQWTEKYDRYVPKDAIAREDQLRGNSNALVKTHALRQTANNPAYVGSSAEDPKAAHVLKAVEQFLSEGRKVVIFCQYNAQAEKYAKLLKAHCPSVYTGITSKKGYRAKPDGTPIRYKQDAHGAWMKDKRGLPLEDANGELMQALDYERLAFQNAPERRIMISTYAAGAVGVTFTAGKATIFDDLPKDIVEEIQAEDRTHRIDHEHQTHHSVKYVRMVARYPESFLEKMRQTWVRKKKDGTYEEAADGGPEEEGWKTAYDMFFAQGTYDEVRLSGLATQRTRFRLINDGIGDPSELPEIKNLAV